MVSDEQKSIVLKAVEIGTAAWKTAFNTGNAAGCASHYEDDAIMRADPFGTFTGTAEIQAFWQNLMEGGYADVNYIEPQIEVIDASSARLTSAWTMNKAAGVIHTDFEKGFIRAEVVAYEDFTHYKGENGAKEAGKWRLEGKDYPVKDGDVMHFRFNV